MAWNLVFKKGILQPMYSMTSHKKESLYPIIKGRPECTQKNLTVKPHRPSPWDITIHIGKEGGGIIHPWPMPKTIDG